MLCFHRRHIGSERLNPVLSTWTQPCDPAGMPQVVWVQRAEVWVLLLQQKAEKAVPLPNPLGTKTKSCSSLPYPPKWSVTPSMLFFFSFGKETEAFHQIPQGSFCRSPFILPATCGGSFWLSIAFLVSSNFLWCFQEFYRVVLYTKLENYPGPQ